MKLILPVESIVQNLGGVVLYDVDSNKILKQYVHDKKWKRVGWRGGKVYGDYLIATDWSDLHYFNIREWKYEKTFKKNTFNDLHHIQIHNDKMYVVNTGLDAIETFNNPMNPEFEKIEFVFKKNPKLFKDRAIVLNENYNTMLKVKPHSCHPNCIEFDKKRIFVTCFAKEQRINTGEIIELNSGKRVTRKHYDCHDGMFYGDDFYTTRTRYATILIFKNLRNTSIPMEPVETIKIEAGKGWWRGMVIYNNMLYVFASDGYRKKKTTVRIAIVNLKTRKTSKFRLPSIDGVHWDTIYQPNLWEE